MFTPAIKFLSLTCWVIFITPNVLAKNFEKPAVESFENDSILNLYQTNGDNKLTISNKHYKFGNQSLQWQWQGKSSLTTKNFRILSHDQSPLKYGDYFPASPTLIISIYSEQKQSTSLNISFQNDNQKNKKVWFDFPLNFYGWRTIEVPFHEMEGDAPEQNTPVNYNTFSISGAGIGNVFIDDIIFSQWQDDRFPYPSQQTLFIQQAAQATASDHWMPLQRNFLRIEKLKNAEINHDVVQNLSTIKNKINTLLSIKNTVNKDLKSLRKDFEKLDLIDGDNTILGPPLTYSFLEFYFNEQQQGNKRYTNLHDFGILLKDLAHGYLNANQTSKIEIEKMFIKASRYYLDQGWQAGTSMGSLHHIGYSTKELVEAFYIMQKSLHSAGLLNDIGASLQWIFNFGIILEDDKNFHANIDYMHTQAFYHLLIVFLTENQNLQAELLKRFSHYISVILAQDDNKGVFKIDGTAWHHGGHYPAYADGAFKKIPEIIYILSGTGFKISTAGHTNFKKAFLASRIYSQKFDFGFGNAGRHPFSGSFSGLKQQYLQLALSGSPQQGTNIDREVVAAYLRLWGKDEDYTSAINDHDIEAENLTGYFSFPYAATAVYRQNDWAVIMKGYSKYVWSSEIYVASNRYGRYPANGTAQLINAKGEKASGYVENGWNWNNFPGATVISLPIELLETPEPLLMFRSFETFIGSVELNNNGLFAMQLNDAKGFNHEGNEKDEQILQGGLKAKKSIFTFGDKLIFIGSDIQSTDKTHPTQTNLFQTFLSDQSMPLATSLSGIVSDFPYYDQKANDWIIDPYGNGYHLLSKNQYSINRQHQHSYHDKYSLRTGLMNQKGKGATKTEGDFANAWINHGRSPNNGAYQYVVYPFIVDSLNENNISTFKKHITDDNSYQILQADKYAHIVADNNTSTIGYALFSADKPITHGLLTSVSDPALIMLQQQNNETATLSIVQPDLNFKQLKPIAGYSEPVSLTMSLKGQWKVAAHAQVTAVNYDNNNTQINLSCQHGLVIKLHIEKTTPH